MKGLLTLFVVIPGTNNILLINIIYGLELLICY